MIDVSLVPTDEPLRVIIGAGEQSWPGWIATHREGLDLLRRDDWTESFASRRLDRLLCEHVWEHLTFAEGRVAAKTCFEFLRPGGTLRVAVPDANFPDENYQRLVAVGQLGHQVLYDHHTLRNVFTGSGFDVDLLEYCDDAGRFHYHDWDRDSGPIYRSLRSDHRNTGARLGFVSLILDAKKPGEIVAVHRSGGHHFSKSTEPCVDLIAGLGVEGDAHAGATVQHRSRVAVDPTQRNLRQVHLLPTELFGELSRLGFDVLPGQLGENITTVGVDLQSLPTGTRLHLGTTAIIELTGLRNPCSQIEQFRPGLLAHLARRTSGGSVERKAGVMGVVIEGGEVRAGDPVRITRPPVPHRPLERV